MTILADAKDWRERWIEADDALAIASGGQGSAKIVRSRELGDGTLYFLKILSRQNDAKRRERMYVEVSCYRVLNHPRIPRLIESNSNSYADVTHKLYLVTEYIPGGCLENVYVPVLMDDAIAASLQLCEILQYCHKNSVVHRDIKPSNIILRNKAIADLVLVDFGMSYHEDVAAIDTPAREEVGNRFVRLPELAAESTLKRDPRSDVTLCAGILFFLLTGIRPAQLSDHEGRMPHQRTDVVRKLSGHSGLDIDQLLVLFDRAFDFRIDHRFQDADELAAGIRACVAHENAIKANDTLAMMQRIKMMVTAPAEVAVREKMAQLTSIANFIRHCTRQIGQSLGDAFGVLPIFWST
jgi:eukaryotic-like serine/threonine-protein kinase